MIKKETRHKLNVKLLMEKGKAKSNKETRYLQIPLHKRIEIWRTLKTHRDTVIY